MLQALPCQQSSAIWAQNNEWQRGKWSMAERGSERILGASDTQVQYGKHALHFWPLSHSMFVHSLFSSLSVLSYALFFSQHYHILSLHFSQHSGISAHIYKYCICDSIYHYVTCIFKPIVARQLLWLLIHVDFAICCYMLTMQCQWSVYISVAQLSNIQYKNPFKSHNPL